MDQVVIPMNETHVYHHHDDDKPGTFNFKIERNTKGFNWEITVNGAHTLEEARSLRDQALQAIAEATRDAS